MEELEDVANDLEAERGKYELEPPMFLEGRSWRAWYEVGYCSCLFALTVLFVWWLRQNEVVKRWFQITPLRSLLVVSAFTRAISVLRWLVYLLVDKHRPIHRFACPLFYKHADWLHCLYTFWIGKLTIEQAWLNFKGHPFTYGHWIVVALFAQELMSDVIAYNFGTSHQLPVCRWLYFSTDISKISNILYATVFGTFTIIAIANLVHGLRKDQWRDVEITITLLLRLIVETVFFINVSLWRMHSHDWFFEPFALLLEFYVHNAPLLDIIIVCVVVKELRTYVLSELGRFISCIRINAPTLESSIENASFTEKQDEQALVNVKQ